MTDAELAALLSIYAAAVEARGATESAGLIREAARRLLRVPDDVCERCGMAIDRKPGGRPPRFCSRACRIAAHRETKALAWIS